MKTRIFSLLILILALSLTAFQPVLPVTGTGSSSGTQASAALPDLASFSSQLKNGQAGQVVGVYVSNVLALLVVQQPADQPGYVSSQNGVVTQFRSAAQLGTIGLLAHNYLSGAQFSALKVGDIVTVVYGDGSQKTFRISTVRRLQALNPTDPRSDFSDLDDAGKKLTVNALFSAVYGVKGQLVFQTCIEANGNASWGRLFVIATPYTNVKGSF